MVPPSPDTRKPHLFDRIALSRRDALRAAVGAAVLASCNAATDPAHSASTASSSTALPSSAGHACAK